METLRCFLALELPGPLRESLSERLDSFRRRAADIKWVEAQNLHLTVKFLGSTDSSLLPAAAAALRGICAQASPFELSLGRAGAFPRLERPRILWAEIAAGRDPLMRLASEVDGALLAAGLPGEERSRPYQAHLTLGRARSAKNLKPLIEDLRTADFSSLGVFLASELVLMRSNLGPDGPVYNLLEKFVFGDG